MLAFPLMLRCGWGEERNHVFTAPTPLGVDLRPAECISSKYLCKEIKANVSFFWHMSCNFIYNLSCAHCKTHCYGIFCFKCQTHSVSMEKLFFSKSRKEFPFSFAERGGRPYPLKWLPAEANYLGLWKRWGVISWR